MTRRSDKTKKLTLTALCAALGVVLPQALHIIPEAGFRLLPMHLPVLLCGLLCGWRWGLACGVITPVLSNLLTSMPPAAMLPSMVVELAVYGLVAGLLMQSIRTERPWVNRYLALIGAMLAGRLAAGLCNALLFSAGKYSLEVWISGMFVTAMPGILLQLALLPLLAEALTRAKVVE